MRIALDGSDLCGDRVEGPSIYAGELLPRLIRVLTERGHAVVTYTPGALRQVTVAGAVRVIPGSPYWTQRVLPSALFRDQPDVLFLPIQMLPVVRPRMMATVAVVHDLEFLKIPETYTWSNRLLLRLFTKAAVHQATRVIAVSQYTKDDVVQTYGRAADDIAVIRHGVDHDRFRPLLGGGEQDTAVRARYDLPDHFILFVGALQPRKNIVGLLGAYEHLVARDPAAPALVLVSGGGWKEEPLLAAIRSSPVRERVHVLRRLTHDELAACYRRAAVFALPSFSEGFGMPVLEAMASGTPVVTSNTSALPEVVGDAALLVDPRNPAAIADALRRVLTDQDVRADLVQRGLERAQQFTWEKTTEATAAVIESAGQGPAGAGRVFEAGVDRPSGHGSLAGTARESEGDRRSERSALGGASGRLKDPPAQKAGPVALSIIIVNWNVGPLLRRCLDALPAACVGCTYEVFVVDNASTDNSVAQVRESPQPFTLIALPQNVGFARANNLALQRAGGDVLLLLNPDTEPRPASLAALVEFCSGHPKAGVVGGKLFNLDGSLQPSVRQFPTPLVLCLILTRLARLFPNLSVLQQYLMAGFSYDHEVTVDQVMGACFAVPRAAFQALGPLDEGYWIWFEEVDYCRRLRQAGYEVWFTPRAEIVHHQATAFRQVSPLWRAWRLSRSALHYAYKNLGPVAAGLVLVCIPVCLLTALMGEREAMNTRQ